jgi:hypothetical protein
MQGNLPWNGYVCNDANEFAIAAEQLYTSKDDWTNAQVHGKQILESLFSSEEHVKGFMNRVSYLLDNLDEHRLTNFTGAMLMHHTIQSTKYLSKWIEEKNRKV